jgi:MinD-like ATPase involved in chromosome partitioning or flagellar assembly
MLTIFTSSKGGSGTTITACGSALLSASHTGSALLIDLCGDVPAALGMGEPSTPGVNEWLAENQTADGESLVLLGNATTQGLIVVHRGHQFVEGQPRWIDLAHAIATMNIPVFIDAGNTYLPEELRSIASQVILVTRPCYLSLRRATLAPTPTSIIVLNEPGRALTARDVSQVMAAPVIAEIPVDPAISRAVDAGLLATRFQQLIAPHLSGLL